MFELARDDDRKDQNRIAVGYAMVAAGSPELDLRVYRERQAGFRVVVEPVLYAENRIADAMGIDKTGDGTGQVRRQFFARECVRHFIRELQVVAESVVD